VAEDIAVGPSASKTAAGRLGVAKPIGCHDSIGP